MLDQLVHGITWAISDLAKLWPYAAFALVGYLGGRYPDI